MPVKIADDEVVLMQRVADGDREACELVIRSLMGRVQRLAMALLGNSADAKDASQDSQVEILRAARGFRGESLLTHWADRIAVRTTLRWAGKERRMRTVALGVAQDRAYAESAPAKVLSDQYLAALPPVQRTALVLRCILQYSVEEIAQLTQVSPNTVKDRLLRSRATLREAYGEGADSETPSIEH